jgi:hypothetical protein
MKYLVIFPILLVIISVFFSQCTTPTSTAVKDSISGPASLSAEPIVGKWYAQPPDDLTFTFYSDGSFIEQSPNWGSYNGKWEKKFGTYVADIKDGSGAPKSANFIYSNNKLMTGSITILQRA